MTGTNLVFLNLSILKMLAAVLSSSFPHLGELFAGQANRTVGYVSSGGAELGEALATLTRINEAFSETPAFAARTRIWCDEWSKVADYVEQNAVASSNNHHNLSARQAFLRSAEYYRQSAFFLRDSITSKEWRESYKRSYACFDRALSNFEGCDWFGEVFDIPFTSKHSQVPLAGRLLLPQQRAKSNVCLIIPGGYDSTMSEMFCSTAIFGLRRGYAAFVFDGPGQGISLLNGHPMQHDFESVLSLVLDKLDTRFASENSPVRYAIIGRSFGGYLVPRGLTTNSSRIAAAIVDPGQLELVPAGDAANALVAKVKRQREDSEGTDAALEHKFFWTSRCTTHLKSSFDELIAEYANYTSRGKLDNVKCPILVLDNPEDTRSHRGTTLYDELKTPKKTLFHFNPLDGASDHCESAAGASFERIVFDWLDEQIA